MLKKAVKNHVRFSLEMRFLHLGEVSVIPDHRARLADFVLSSSTDFSNVTLPSWQGQNLLKISVIISCLAQTGFAECLYVALCTAPFL